MEANYDKPRLSSIKSVQTWFESMQHTDEEKLPFWTLYSGLTGKVRVGINYHIDDPAKSWELLEKNLNLYEPLGGIFEIYITSKSRGNNGLLAVLDLPSQSNQPNQNKWNIGSLPDPAKETLQSEITNLKLEMLKFKYESEIEALKKDRKGINGFIQTIVEHPTWDSARAVQAVMFGIDKVAKVLKTEPQQAAQPVQPVQSVHQNQSHQNYGEELRKELIALENKTEVDALLVIKKVNKLFEGKSKEEIEGIMSYLNA